MKYFLLASTLFLFFCGQKSESEQIVFYLENDTIIQSLEVLKLDAKKIEFTLKTVNKSRNIDNEITGTAISENAGLKQFSDESGNPRTSNKYIFKNSGCWMAIDIDSENQSMAFTQESNCSDDINCPMKSIGLMKRRDS
jgi:hypothetical protein